MDNVKYFFEGEYIFWGHRQPIKEVITAVIYFERTGCSDVSPRLDFYIPSLDDTVLQNCLEGKYTHIDDVSGDE